MFENGPKLASRNHRGVRGAFEQKQPRRLLMALVLLLIALTLVVVKDREFWFGSDELADANPAEPQLASVVSTPKPTVSTPAPAAAAPAPSATAAAKRTSSAPAKSAVSKPTVEPEASTPGIVASNRTVLPPLSVEVIAGDSHRTLHPGSNAIKVEIPNSPAQPAPGGLIASAPATNAAELERLTPAIANIPDQSLPLLAQRARVEGSVVLQALIGADGIIRDLRVLSGPAVLAPAAQQAVRQWRFRPYLQNGTPVETKANITVNFTIKVSDTKIT